MTEDFTKDTTEAYEMSDTNFNFALTVKDVLTNSIVDYSPYLSFDFSLPKGVNGT